MNYEHFSHPDKKKDIFLVDMHREKGYFSELMSRAIEKNLKEKKKILIIVNKKGYASGLLCQSCGHIPRCHQCDVSIGYHQTHDGGLMGLCHICKTVYPLPSVCPECHKSDTLILYGLTLQKTAEWIEQSYHIRPTVIDASSLSYSKKIEKSLTEIAKAPIVIATSAIISPPSFPPLPPLVGRQVEGGPQDSISPCERQSELGGWGDFGLIIIPSADQRLTVPDYAVREKNFVMLYDSFTHRATQHYIVQSYKVDHLSIRFACKLDPQGFYEQEAIFRSAHHYPPYGELCIIKYNHQDENRLHNAIETLTKELRFLQHSYGYAELDIYSTPPLVYKKFGKFYYHIIIIGEQVRLLMDIAFSKLQMVKRGYKIDWMAEGMV